MNKTMHLKHHCQFKKNAGSTGVLKNHSVATRLSEMVACRLLKNTESKAKHKK